MGVAQLSRVLAAADQDARHTFPTMTVEDCERAKDAAFAVMVSLMQAGRDAGACRAQYLNQVRLFERAAGYGE